MIDEFVRQEKAQPFSLKGYDHFDDRVIYMGINMSLEGQRMHDRLIDQMSKVSYIQFDKQDGKDKTFHVTVASKKLKSCYQEVWGYVSKWSCNFDMMFDNISIYKWEESTWKLYKVFNLVK